ncbi:hypothetical protein [Nocardia amikacinitolerans]|uniref:hypothetical protein n=1 Tax=Nocardia amikacinitolerans TaxID=756689 RepID=UPI0020A53B7F|nr:hypothetical protein [Nocardia amikacinitolerans]MCP2290953.1 hypothetical protein [Nocardia amikacinitolerans]
MSAETVHHVRIDLSNSLQPRSLPGDSPSAVSASKPRQLGQRHCFPAISSAVLFASVALFGLTGCDVSHTPVNLADAKQIAASCPSGREIAGRAAIDVSAHMRPIAADAGRLDPVRQLVRRTLICGGHLRIDAFSGSSAATAAVFDADLHLPGATETARLRREPAMTDEVMATITKQLPIAAEKLPLTGSDILAQFGMAAEYVQQLDPDGSRFALYLVITTDGAQSEGTALTDPTLTVERALVLAERVRVPDLTGATVQMTSIGKTADPAPPTAYVDALKAFFTSVCKATGAYCTVVTDGAAR